MPKKYIFDKPQDHQKNRGILQVVAQQEKSFVKDVALSILKETNQMKAILLASFLVTRLSTSVVEHFLTNSTILLVRPFSRHGPMILRKIRSPENKHLKE